jgi:hypothetical protein
MELTINIKMDERFAAAVEVLAAAVVTYAKAYEKAHEYVYECAGDCGPHPGELKVEPTEVVEEITPTVVETAPVAAVDKAAPTLTRAELQAKAARLMQIERGKYALDLKGALEQCGAANISSLDESMFEKFNSLMADLWEVAA